METAAAGFRFAVSHVEVSDFSGGPVGAGNNLTVQDDAGSDAGAQGDQNGTPVSGGPSLPGFPQGGHIGVISGFHPGDAAQFPEGGAYVEAAPAQIRAPVHDPLFQHRTRDAQTGAPDPGKRDGKPDQNLAQGSCDVRQDVPAFLFPAGGDLPLFCEIPGICSEKSELHRGAADIDADRIFCHFLSVLSDAGTVMNPGNCDTIYSNILHGKAERTANDCGNDRENDGFL